MTQSKEEIGAMVAVLALWLGSWFGAGYLLGSLIIWMTR